MMDLLNALKEIPMTVELLKVRREGCRVAAAKHGCVRVAVCARDGSRGNVPCAGDGDRKGAQQREEADRRRGV